MKWKDKIWNKKRNWFTFRFSLVFLVVGIIFEVLPILEMTLWSKNDLFAIICSFLSLVFFYYLCSTNI